MSILLAQPRAGVLEISEGDLLPRVLPVHFPWPCVPAASRSLAAVCCAQTRECVLLKRRGWEIISQMPAAPGISAVCLSPCGRYVYQLGSEADCVHALCAATGELMYAAPVGVFPRMMRLSTDGKSILAAGGAAPEALVLDAPALTCQRVIHTRHPCFDADFWREGLVLVCAAEGNDIHTAVYTLPFRALRPRKLLELPGQPGGACMCPDQRHLLLSTPDGLMKVELETGKILWNRPEWPLCMRICCREGLALISDTLCGRACLLDHDRPWNQRVLCSGFGAQACFLP